MAEGDPASKGRIHYSEHIVGNGEKLLNSLCATNLEGLISKRASSLHVGSRNGA